MKSCCRHLTQGICHHHKKWGFLHFWQNSCHTTYISQKAEGHIYKQSLFCTLLTTNTNLTNPEVLTTHVCHKSSSNSNESLKAYPWLNEKCYCFNRLIHLMQGGKKLLLPLCNHNNCQHTGRWFAQLLPQKKTDTLEVGHTYKSNKDIWSLLNVLMLLCLTKS